MKIQNLKPKQLDILLYLYKYRFLNRKQIQTMLGHKHFNRVIVWLNELVKEGYIVREFTREFGAKPAVYFLDVKSKKVLEDERIKEIKVHQNIPLWVKTSLLKRVYKEKGLSQKFRTHCLFVANIHLSAEERVKELNRGAKIRFYAKTNLTGLGGLITPEPDAFFSIDEGKKKVERYFLDVFDPLPPRMILRKRIKDWIEYFDSNQWQKYHEPNISFPNVIIVCPDITSFKYLKKFIKKSLNTFYSDLQFYLSTWEEIQQKGLRKETLHRVSIE